ncbi:hypothetical protein ACGFJC_44705 [Nonomuraea fuscirosea]
MSRLDVNLGSGKTHYSRGMTSQKGYTSEASFFEGEYCCKARWTN